MFHGEAGISRYDGRVPSHGLSPVEIPPLTDVPTITKIKGDIIYGSDWPADKLVVLHSGRIYSHREDASGERFAWMNTAPSILGYEALEGLREYRATAIAFDESTIQYIDRQRLSTLIQEDTSFRMQLLISILSQTRKRQNFVSARFCGAAAAIASTLVDLAEEPNNEIRGVSQKTISILSGFTRESVITQMQRFRDRGFILYKKKWRTPSNIELLQPGALHFVVENGSLPPVSRANGDIRPKT